MNRRQLIKQLAGLGVGTLVFQRAVAVLAEGEARVTPEMIQQAEWICGLQLSDEERRETARTLQNAQADLNALRNIPIDYAVSPAFVFQPLVKPELAPAEIDRNLKPIDASAPAKPNTADDLAFLSIAKLSGLVRERIVTSVELTKAYLNRLKRFNPVLNCVVNLTEELALTQASRADEEIAAGKYRGPLHGIPWGAKDLIAVPGYPTTWGAPQFEKRQLHVKATVAQRLEDAGAVLLAKLSLGALAMGDQWFGGMTRSPWNPNVGSSGSSAGSASAVVAGLAGFTLGSETLGSIISPSRVCGASGLRPTFGRVSRYGCMSLSWTMDKIGPICRSIEDCALVFAAIHGADGLDPTARDAAFQWPPRRDMQSIKVGYVKSEGESPDDRQDITTLKKLGVQLVEVELPNRLPVWAIADVLDIEAATAFDELTKTGNVEGLNAWPRIFRKAKFTSAVDYVQAMRARRLLMEEMEELMSKVDVLINAEDLGISNLTGHPSAVLPVGYKTENEIDEPISVVFTGQLDGESDLLAIAHAYQQLVEPHLKRPPMEEHLRKFNEEKKKSDL